jgi:hypothetical protein
MVASAPDPSRLVRLTLFVTIGYKVRHKPRIAGQMPEQMAPSPRRLEGLISYQATPSQSRSACHLPTPPLAIKPAMDVAWIPPLPSRHRPRWWHFAEDVSRRNRSGLGRSDCAALGFGILEPLGPSGPETAGLDQPDRNHHVALERVAATPGTSPNRPNLDHGHITRHIERTQHRSG